MRVYFLSLTILLFTISLTAQITYQGPADGFVSSGLTLNTNNFSNPSGLAGRLKMFNVFEYDANPEIINWGDTLYHQGDYYELINRMDNTLDSTILFVDFEGIPQTPSIPPDDYIAAGPDHLMMVVNSEFRIFDKNGNVLKTINADEWYGNLVSNISVFDPKVIYDQISSRWVMIWLAAGEIQGTNYFLLSVSDDSDPSGNWFNWALPSDVNGNTPAGNWADYEGVGYDENAIYLTSNQFQFSGFYDYVKLRIIDKSDIYINSNPSVASWKDIWSITTPGNSNSAYGIRPARMQSSAADFYLVYIPSYSGNYCSLYKLTDPVNNPSLTGTNLQITSFTSPPNASQLGGTFPIETNGAHLLYEPIFSNGIIYFVHTIENPTITTLSSLHFLAINTVTNTVDKDIIMGDDQHFFFFPALAIDKNNDIIFSYSRSSVNEYAGGYYTILPDSSVPTGSYALKPGNAYYFKDYGSGRNRWGDYSGAWIDPADSISFWICTEYVEALNTWGTWAGGVIYDSEVPVELVSFNAGVYESNIKLNWVVASETNNYGYELSRKIDSKPDQGWENIAFIPGKGTTTKRQSYIFTDKNPEDGYYKYRLAQIDLNGIKNILAETRVNFAPVINQFILSQNYPNPFNPSTHISYEIPSGINSIHIKLTVYDLLGNEVAVLVNENKRPGKYDLKFDTKGLTSGVYFYRLVAGDFSSVRKMVLLH